MSVRRNIIYVKDVEVKLKIKRVLKDRIKRKRIKKENQRLRNRKKKRKSRFILMTINGIELETINKLRRLAKSKNISISKLIPRLLSKYMREQECLNLKEE